MSLGLGLVHAPYSTEVTVVVGAVEGSFVVSVSDSVCVMAVGLGVSVT